MYDISLRKLYTQNVLFLIYPFVEMLVSDDSTEPKVVKRTFSVTQLSKMFLRICGVPDRHVNVAVEITIESRKIFLTETSKFVKRLNIGLAILLILVVMFLIIYYH